MSDHFKALFSSVSTTFFYRPRLETHHVELLNVSHYRIPGYSVKKGQGMSAARRTYVPISRSHARIKFYRGHARSACTKCAQIYYTFLAHLLVMCACTLNSLHALHSQRSRSSTLSCSLAKAEKAARTLVGMCARLARGRLST